MKRLWIAFLLLATLGSIYPFDFQLSELNGTTLTAFLRSCCGMPGRGDLLGNVILFVPIGFIGMLALGRDATPARRFLIVCAVGGLTALLLQVMQLFLPTRDENLQDVVWNLLGIAIGSMLARRVDRHVAQPGRFSEQVSLVPLTLVGAWLVYKLLPFVPSIDLQSIKDSVKPLLFGPISATALVHDIAAWLAVAYLLRGMRDDIRLDVFLPLLIAAVLCLEVVIVDNVIDKSDVVGALVAILAWWALQQYTHRQEGTLLLILFGMLALTGVAPFDPRLEPAAFKWMPFQGFLEGSMYVNTQSAAEKVFLYGSLVYLLWRARVSVIGGVAIAFSFVLAIEFAQTFLIGRTPEITDPLLVVFAALALVAVERHQGAAVAAGNAEGAGREGSMQIANTIRGVLMKTRRQWISQTINLKEHQSSFLTNLAREMGVSVSRVTRRIIEQFIEALDSDGSLAPSNGSNGSGRDAVPERWVPVSVNFRRHQFDFLQRLGREMGVSVSGATRLIIAHFINRLESEESPAPSGALL